MALAPPKMLNRPPAKKPSSKPGTEDIIETPTWWEAQNIPWQLVRELRRRKNDRNIGQNIPPSQQSDLVTNFQVNHPEYKGPLTPWVRAFSNGTGRGSTSFLPNSQYLLKNGKMPKYDGFLLEGGKGFNNAYGYKRSGDILVDDKAILGYEANGNPHYIDTRYINGNSYNYSTNTGTAYPQNNQAPRVLPPPGIVSINIKTNKEMMAFATINWKCYSLAQLEYMTPFWLCPKINVFLEFGYNLFNIKSLVNYSDESECYQLLINPHKALSRWYDSYGNYGLVTGLITKYDFSTTDGFVYNCTTELTSRQALYSGFRTDNPVITTSTPTTSTKTLTKEYLTLKDFLKNYLTPTVAKGCLLDKKNYVQHVFDYMKGESSQSNENSTEENDGYDDIKNYAKTFFGGKQETRIFFGRDPEIYGAALNSTKEAINAPPPVQPISSTYPTYTAPGAVKRIIKKGAIRYPKSQDTIDPGYEVISDADMSTDFDAKQGSQDRVWYQLDFVFDIINLFCEEMYTKNNRIDISDILIGAHPNLISCNSNVLIPNAVSPKLNKGTIFERGGFLRPNEENNPFFGMWSFQNWSGKIGAGIEKEQKIIEEFKKNNNNIENFPSKNLSTDPWKAAQKQKNTFKTNGAPRDNLDSIINKIYYDRTAEYGHSIRNASFPNLSPINASNIGTREYAPYYTGFLKYIYVSNTVLEGLSDITDSSNTNTLRNLVKSLLNTLNESVDNFWNLDVVQSEDGGLSIIDKNMPILSKKLYAFDFGTTNNVVKSFDFKVNLTNEQAVQVLYGSGQNVNSILSELSNIQTNDEISATQKRSYITQLQTGLPKLNYQDRFEEQETRKQFKIALSNIEILEQEEKRKKEESKQPSDGDNSTVPRGPYVDLNNEIRKFQIKSSHNKEVLTMRLKRIKPDEEFSEDGESSFANPYNWVNLNLPPSMRGKLRELLDDGDTRNNKSKYAGPADNLTLNIKLDGMFGFRMFQHFAVMNLPKPYVPGNVIFMITEVDHQISEGKWETNLTALLRCTSDQEYEYIYI